MATARKKRKVTKKTALTKASKPEKVVEEKPKIQEENQVEKPVVPDVVAGTAENNEVAEEVSAESKEEKNPLTDFKEKMNEEERDPYTKPQRNFMWPILFVFIIGLAFLVGLFIYRQDNNSVNEPGAINTSSSPTNQPEETPSPTNTPEPEPSEAMELSDYSIEILNGSEVFGEAGRQQTNLEEEGFAVASVGNADSSDYSETIIQAKKNVSEEFLDKLRSFLEESFAVGEIEELSEDSESDVIIILGSETN